MNKQHILLIFGGQSSEHDVSITSAKAIYSALSKDRYEISLINITRSGDWLVVDNLNDNTGHKVVADISERSFNYGDNLSIMPDVIFPVLHGKYGEDGTIQGLLEMMNLPYVGCGVEASALCMDKVRAKQLLEQAGIPVTPSLHVSRHENYQQLLSFNGSIDQAQFEYMVGGGPWFVKPSRAGSSVGVTKVHESNEIIQAVGAAFEHDDDVLIEQAITAHEIEIAVLGNDEELIVSQPGEVVPGAEFYSYEDKYAKGSASSVSFKLPEPIVNLSEKLRLLAGTTYRLLGCQGLSRVDFFVTDEGVIYVNEINTMPGFTSISMYPKLMQANGYELPELVDKLIELALE